MYYRYTDILYMFCFPFECSLNQFLGMELLNALDIKVLYFDRITHLNDFNKPLEVETGNLYQTLLIWKETSIIFLLYLETDTILLDLFSFTHTDITIVSSLIKIWNTGFFLMESVININFTSLKKLAANFGKLVGLILT